MLEPENKLVVLPKDTGPHILSNIEWWYFFTYLNGDKGGRYAVMGSFFRVGETEWNKGSYLIYTLIDLSQKTHQNYSFYDSKLKMNMLLLYLPGYLLLNPTDSAARRLYIDLLRANPPAPHSPINKVQMTKHPTKLTYDSNQLTFLGQKEDSFHVQLTDNQTEIDLVFTPTKPIALIGGDGKPDELYYYSFTRNDVTGQLRTNRGVEKVVGRGWFDHQWGLDYGLARGSGWNWFGLQLEDGRELLLNQENTKQGRTGYSPMANLIEKDSTLRFTRNVFFEKLGFWKSLKTNAKYPIEWKITVPDFSIELHVRAVFPNQEMPILGPIYAIWEGACSVEGQEKLPDGSTRSLCGKGFMELVGYAFK